MCAINGSRDNNRKVIDDGMTEGWNDEMKERGNNLCPSHFMAVAKTCVN